MVICALATYFPWPLLVSLVLLPNATSPTETIGERGEGKRRGRNVTSTELFKLKDVQCLTIERSTKQCHSAFPRRDSKHSSARS